MQYPCVRAREVVIAAVGQEGWALKYATEALKGDREVVMAAVVQDGTALRYATEDRGPISRTNPPVFGISSFRIPTFGIPGFGIPDFGIPGFGISVSGRVPVWVFPTFGIPAFGSPVLGIPTVGIPVLSKIGRTQRGSCNRTLLRRVLRRFFKGSAS